MHRLNIVIYAEYMGVAVAELGTARTGSWVRTGERDGHRHRNLLDQPLPRGTFLDSLSPLFPLWKDSALPSRLDLTFLRPHNDAVYAASLHLSQREAATHAQEQSGGVIFINSTARSFDDEAGMVLSVDSRDRRVYPSQIVTGSEDDIGPLTDVMNVEMDHGRYPLSYRHSHNEAYLPLPSAPDWALVLQDVWFSGIPVLRDLTTLGVQVQTMFVLTDKSLPLMNQDEAQQFIAEQEGRLKGLPVEERDLAAVALADHVKAAAYMSLDNGYFERATPIDILRKVQTMEAYKLPLAA